MSEGRPPNLATAAAMWLAALISAVAGGATLPAGFSETSVAGLTNPTAFAVAPDGRIFVSEQGGALRVIENGALLPAPFTSIAVDSNGERGLLGVAFDPDFEQNGYVYVYFTRPSPNLHNRVSRFTADGNVAVPASEVVVLDLDPLSSATNHNGGAIHFGPDGRLYVATGDNANGANAQTLANLHGKILRIGSDGAIPVDNPFFDTASGQERAIWALGLRNPFTFAIHRATGRMFINDVGQNSWEEINDGIAGSNYGWPATEGPTSNPAYREPLHAYGHGISATTGCAIAGGAFYDPPAAQFPPSYAGTYFFADLCSGWIRVYDPATDTASGFASGIASPVDVHVGPDGSLYYLARGSGALRRVVYTANAIPSIETHPADVTVSIGQPATFEVVAAGATPLSYRWQRDGIDIDGADGPSYTLTAGSGDDGAEFRCIVTNPFGDAESDAATLTVRPPAQRTFVSAADGNDANPCTRALPCRSFGAAVPRTAEGGEVVALDSGGYGPVVVDRPVALIAPSGIHASITAFSGSAVLVAVGNVASDVIVLRGLTLQGAGAEFGIEFQNGDALHIEKCTISGFWSYGVYGYSLGRVYVEDSISRGNLVGFAFASGIVENRAILDRVRAESNSFAGIAATENSIVTVNRSIAAGNGAGFVATTSSSELSLNGCTAASNVTGVQSAGLVRVSNSAIVANEVGVVNDPGGTTISFGNNRLAGNGTDGTFIATIALQ